MVAWQKQCPQSRRPTYLTHICLHPLLSCWLHPNPPVRSPPFSSHRSLPPPLPRHKLPFSHFHSFCLRLATKLLRGRKKTRKAIINVTRVYLSCLLLRPLPRAKFVRPLQLLLPSRSFFILSPFLSPAAALSFLKKLNSLRSDLRTR